MTYHQTLTKTNTTSGARTAYHSWAPKFTPALNGYRDVQSLVFNVTCYDLVLVLFLVCLLAIVLSLLLVIASHYPFGIFNFCLLYF
jgi:hypothetical protein